MIRRAFLQMLSVLPVIGGVKAAESIEMKSTSKHILKVIDPKEIRIESPPRCRIELKKDGIVKEWYETIILHFREHVEDHSFIILHNKIAQIFHASISKPESMPAGKHLTAIGWWDNRYLGIQKTLSMPEDQIVVIMKSDSFVINVVWN